MDYPKQTPTLTTSNTEKQPAEVTNCAVIFRGKDFPLSELTPFQRKHAVETWGKVEQCEQRRDGALVVKFSTEEVARSALASTHLTFWSRDGDKRVERRVEVESQLHRDRPRSEGIISCRQLRDVSDEEITDELADQGVTQVRRMGKTDTLVLSFDRQSIPERILVGYLSVPVRIFVPDPLRCYRCHRFGHGAKSCRAEERCGQCGQRGHSGECVAADKKCVNCGEDHAAWNRKCKVYVREKEIASIRVTRGITFPEARKLYDETNPPVSYRDKVASNRPTAEALTTRVGAAQSSGRGGNTSPMPAGTNRITLGTKVRDLLDMTVGDLLRMLLQLLPPAESGEQPAGRGQDAQSTPSGQCTNAQPMSSLNAHTSSHPAALSSSPATVMNVADPTEETSSASLSVTHSMANSSQSPGARGITGDQPPTSARSVGEVPEVTASRHETPGGAESDSEHSAGGKKDPWTKVGRGGKPIRPGSSANAESPTKDPARSPTSSVARHGRVEAPKVGMGPPPIPPPPKRAPRQGFGPAPTARPRPQLDQPGMTSELSAGSRPEKRSLSANVSPIGAESPQRRQRRLSDPRTSRSISPGRSPVPTQAPDRRSPGGRVPPGGHRATDYF